MLHLAMAAGLVAGLVFGLLAGALDAVVLLAVVDAVEPLGALFINAIRMVVVPLVVLTIFVGVARLGSPRRIGRMGGWALGFFWLTTVPAILLGMGVMALALPWAPQVAVDAAAVEAPTELPGLVDFLVGLVPSNPFEAATEGDLLGLIVFTTLFAGAVGTLDAERRERVLSLAEDLNRALVTLVRWVLWTAPVGIFALAAPVCSEPGRGSRPSWARDPADAIRGGSGRSYRPPQPRPPSGSAFVRPIERRRRGSRFRQS